MIWFTFVHHFSSRNVCSAGNRPPIIRMPCPQPKYYTNWATRPMSCYYYFFHGLAALVALGLLTFEVPQSHSDTPHLVGLLWTSDRPVAEISPDNTHHSQETNIHAPGGIQTRNPSKRTAVDPRLRPDRQSQIMRLIQIYGVIIQCVL
jgi:hypothetical protein